jgi:hypothetical protein
MDYEIRVTQVGPQPTAVVRRQAKQNELIKVIPPACSEVWDFFRTSLLPRPGRNVVLYLDEVINLEVGVEVALPFTGNGEYVRLHEAHAAIHRWCAAFNHVRTGPNWEVYGHWEDDPVKRRTDVYYLLQADGTTP